MEQEPADREFIAHLVSTAVEDLAAKNDHKDIRIKSFKSYYKSTPPTSPLLKDILGRRA